MDFDKTQVRLAAAAYELERGELAAFVAEAAAELNAIGDFWGGTQEGVTFFKGQGGGSGYEAVSGQIIEGVEVLLETHDAIAERLRAMADNVQVADWNNALAALAVLPAADPGRTIWGAGR